MKQKTTQHQLYSHREPPSKDEALVDNAAKELLQQLGATIFWCGDDTKHINNPNYHLDFCCFTHVVGLPRHPATNKEMPLTPYQVEFANEIINDTKLPVKKNTDTITTFKKLVDDFLRQSHFYHVLKGRQMGFTEIMLRLIQFFCFSRYVGYNIGIIAATNGRLAKKNLRRFARLFKNIPSVVTQWIKNNTMTLVNGIIIEAFKATEEAITGDTRYKCILADESAKWRLVYDEPVYNSIEPIIRASGGDLFVLSTPKGPVKTFYKIINEKITEYKQLKYDIWRTLGNLYTRKAIEQMLSSKTSDPEQEYLCKFTTAEDSIFGEITKANRGKGWSTWDAELQSDDLENDNFKEDESDWEAIHENDM